MDTTTSNLYLSTTKLNHITTVILEKKWWRNSLKILSIKNDILPLKYDRHKKDYIYIYIYIINIYQFQAIVTSEHCKRKFQLLGDTQVLTQ